MVENHLLMTVPPLIKLLHCTSPFPVRICIPNEDESQWNEHPHRE